MQEIIIHYKMTQADWCIICRNKISIKPQLILFTQKYQTQTGKWNK